MLSRESTASFLAPEPFSLCQGTANYSHFRQLSKQLQQYLPLTVLCLLHLCRHHFVFAVDS